MPERASRCPVCGKPATSRHRPFCSAHCADIDLGRWLTEQYRVPADTDTDESESGSAEGDP